MFDIEKAIAAWRSEMRGEGVKSPGPLEELETHLREEFERQRQPGRSEDESFRRAVETLGEAHLLRREFVKIERRPRALLRWLKRLILGDTVSTPLLTFSRGAQEALESARLEAPRLHHNFVGTEHVLLALLKLETGAVPDLFKKTGVDREDVQRRIEQWVSNFPSDGVTGYAPYTPRVKKALRLASKEAKARQFESVEPEHLLLGLILEGDGVAARVMRGMGLRIETVRRQLS